VPGDGPARQPVSAAARSPVAWGLRSDSAWPWALETGRGRGLGWPSRSECHSGEAWAAVRPLRRRQRWTCAAGVATSPRQGRPPGLRGQARPMPPAWSTAVCPAGALPPSVVDYARRFSSGAGPRHASPAMSAGSCWTSRLRREDPAGQPTGGGGGYSARRLSSSAMSFRGATTR